VRVLLDTCVWGGVKQLLAQAGHDVIWTGDWEKDPGDDEILAKLEFASNRSLGMVLQGTH
jgi:predicted nuclease of predicted toxin-antitoxin system